jgi:hypothetical protein
LNNAPVLLFVYNRPIHTLMTLGALAQNEGAEQTDLIIYADAAKKPEHQKHVDEVRQIIRQVKGFKSVQIIEQKENKGLSVSIVSGVTDQLQKYGKVIVLEDDLLTSPFFLSYMNQALTQYEQVDEVISVHGYSYPVSITHTETYFLKGADCWGWATWKRGWDLLEKDGNKLKAELLGANRLDEFDFEGNYPYSKMLDKQIEGRNDSWAILWYASAFLKNKLTLYPAQSLIQNTGLDASGTHSKSDRQYIHESLSLKVPTLTDRIQPDAVAYDAICQFFRQQRSLGKNLRRIIERFR